MTLLATGETIVIVVAIVMVVFVAFAFLIADMRLSAFQTRGSIPPRSLPTLAFGVSQRHARCRSHACDILRWIHVRRASQVQIRSRR